MEKITKGVSIKLTIELNNIELSLTQAEWDKVENSDTRFGIRRYNSDDGNLNPAYDIILENIGADIIEWVEEIDIDIEDA